MNFYTVTVTIDVDTFSHANAVQLVQDAITTANRLMIDSRKADRLEVVKVSADRGKGK